MWFVILLVLVVGGLIAFRYRVQLLAKVLGQPERRVQHALDQRHKRR